MQLTLQSEQTGEVVVIRARGRIVSGEDAQFLQHEVEKLMVSSLGPRIYAHLHDMRDKGEK